MLLFDIFIGVKYDLFLYKCVSQYFVRTIIAFQWDILDFWFLYQSMMWDCGYLLINDIISTHISRKYKSLFIFKVSFSSYFFNAISYIICKSMKNFHDFIYFLSTLWVSNKIRQYFQNWTKSSTHHHLVHIIILDLCQLEHR